MDRLQRNEDVMSSVGWVHHHETRARVVSMLSQHGLRILKNGLKWDRLRIYLMTNRSVQPYGSNDSLILVLELFKTHCLMVQFDARSLQVTHAIKKRNPMELRCAHATTCNGRARLRSRWIQSPALIPPLSMLSQPLSQTLLQSSCPLHQRASTLVKRRP